MKILRQADHNSARRLRVYWAVVALWYSLVQPVFAALDSRDVFKHNEDAVFQIRVSNKETEVKSSIGSGFIFRDRDSFITNYHVVGQYIEQPES